MLCVLNSEILDFQPQNFLTNSKWWNLKYCVKTSTPLYGEGSKILLVEKIN